MHRINWLVLLSLLFTFSCTKHVIKPPMLPDYSYKAIGEFKFSKMKNSPPFANKNHRFTSLGFEKIPFRTIAVHPQKILPGTVLFVPQMYGWLMPSGEIHDGYFLAEEIDTVANQNSISVFTRNKKKMPVEGKTIAVYRVNEPILSSVRKRFQTRKSKRKSKQLDELTAADFDTLLQNQQNLPAKLGSKIQMLSEKGKGAPYEIFLLGEGPSAKYDKDPLMDFARFDCMTFCEHVLAASISDSYSKMFENLKRIRYKNGEIHYLSRNHYTIADWLPNNHWLLKDVTTEVGGSSCAKMTKIIDRKSFFKSNGVVEDDLQNITQPETLTVDYIPAVMLSKIKNNLHGGEIVSIVTSYPAIISAHMGIIVRDSYGNLLFRHASSSRANRAVVDEFFDEYAADLQNSKTRLGMIFMRIHDKVQVPLSAEKPLPEEID
ncbi:MAG: DUF1460 domain-containing protein [Calditrichaeota bacterium]|nr:MAG: DUF1460 domain-containing protein [Calditrichota bacterium]